MSHLFIHENAAPFASWQKVFTHHKIISSDEIEADTAFDIVWFKLSLQKDVTPQLDWLFQHYGQYKIVVLSNVPRFEEAIVSLKGGARAYVNAFAGAQTLKQIEEVVNQGGIWLGADLMQALIASSQKSNSAQDEARSKLASHEVLQDKLSAREFEVAKLIAEGDSNKVIARKLNIAERTVKAHVSTIFTKLDVKDRLKLALLFTSK
jgi:DNA-binding NarL/FixJ family response regulator